MINKKIAKHIKMVYLTLYELQLIAGRKGIKNYENMSREELLSTLDESERNFNNLSQNELEKITKMLNQSAVLLKFRKVNLIMQK